MCADQGALSGPMLSSGHRSKVCSTLVFPSTGAEILSIFKYSKNISTYVPGSVLDVGDRENKQNKTKQHHHFPVKGIEIR